MGRSLAIGILAATMACETNVPPAGGNPDAFSALCQTDEDCPSGLRCVGGVCGPADDVDAGQMPAAAIEVCAGMDCSPDLTIDFGASRIGSATTRSVTIRSVGEAPLDLLNVDVLDPSSEFTTEPGGDLGITVQPGETVVVRVTHRATDGQADREQLQIVSNATRPRVLVDLVTEYKGTPTLYLGPDAARNVSDAMLVDFGNVPVGVPQTRTLYIKNVDALRGGSVLSVSEVRVDPATSTQFTLTTDRTIPVFLNRFDALCTSDASCDAATNETCDTAVGVCRDPGGALRDILTLTLTYESTQPGPIEERLLVLSNDGGQNSTIRSVLLRANGVFSSLMVTPDPVDFPEVFVGYPQRKTVTLANMGTSALTVQSVQLNGDPGLSLDTAGLMFPAPLAAGQSVDVEVEVDPAAAGPLAGTLTVLSDVRTATVTNVAVTARAFEAPRMQVSISPVDFGQRHIGSTHGVQVRLQNVGGGELRVTSLARTATTPNVFSTNRASLPPIGPGGEEIVEFRYAPIVPSWPAAQEGAIQVDSNDPATPTRLIGVRGLAVNPNALVLPGLQINFNTLTNNPNAPNVYLGQQVHTTVTVVNSGIGPLLVSGARIGNDWRGAFTLQTPVTGPVVIPERQQLALDLRYAPPRSGTDGAELIIDTNDLDIPGGRVRVGLVGSAVVCPGAPNTVGTSNPAGVCSYVCATDFHDLDGDLTDPNGNGCEYACVFRSMNDLPDDAFTDANCDGIDGEVGAAIYVSPTGSDTSPGDRAQPKRSISAGIRTAALQGKDVYVAGGTYMEAASLRLEAGVRVFGAYSPTDWGVRSDANITELTVADTRAVVANNLSQPAWLDHLTIQGADNTDPGGSAYGIFAVDSRDLLVRRCVIRAGGGGAGTPGASPGGSGARGGNGSQGRPGCEESGGFCSGCSRPTGGFGGTSICGRTGGRGGSAGRDNAHGNPGATGVGGTAGGPGAPNGRGNWNTPSTYWGRDGARGAAGQDGASGAERYQASGYAPTTGGGGQSGQPGNGGGGGGGGGGGNDDCDSYGGGGGGGGAGGCGGTGASGGTSAGGSFAVYLWASTINIERSELVTATGGRGGDGGRGQPGGSGGEGGHGVLAGAGNTYGGGGEQDDGSNGGRGGWGGNGGRGGHGGGGAGGPSIGVLLGNGSVATLTAELYTLGAGGAGGFSAGRSGDPGRRTETHRP